MRYLADGWLVSYDITNDARRLSIAHLLEREGVRHLYSGFWLPSLSGPRIDELLDGIEGDVRPGDRLIAVRSCRQCLTYGSGRPLEELHTSGQVL